MITSNLSDLALWVYEELNFAFKPEFNGLVSWACLYCVCSMIGIENKFIQDYGICGDWEIVENGRPILINVGDFIQWVNQNS